MRKIVTISGGTGGYNLLNAIKTIENIDISAVVCMTDDGGSTGVLRDELGVLPAGDIRQCLSALSQETSTIRKLLAYRFEKGSLKGINFGNILLAGLEKINGSFIKGLKSAELLLKVSGRVIPVLDQSCTLVAGLQNGKKIIGESKIYSYSNQKNNILYIYIKEKNILTREAEKAILESDCIIIGPGDLFCSILPTLSVNGFKQAIKRSNGKVIYILNLTNRRGHTLSWTANRYVERIENVIGKKINHIIINDEQFSSTQKNKYLKKEGRGVEIENDLQGDERVVSAKLLSHKKILKSSSQSYIRHDSEKLKKQIQKIIAK